MARITENQKQVIKKCQKSVTWFLRNCGKLKHPSAGIVPFYPFSYQRRAIKAFRENRLNIFRKCVAADTTILTDNDYKNICDLKRGDLVYSLDMSSHILRVNNIINVWSNGIKPTIKIILNNNNFIKCTTDHPIFTSNGWINAGDLLAGERVITVAEDLTVNTTEVAQIVASDPVDVWDIEVDRDHNFIANGLVAHNCRQAGASKIAGAFALWYAMFHNHKTILIVSRTDDAAMGFLREQIVFLFEHLPEWMQDLWKPLKQNEHEIVFPNGSSIKSLTSHPDVLRSNASSLNIIDEAAFIQGMDAMWCVSPATMVMSDNGLYPIIDIKEGDMIYGTDWRDCYKTYYTAEKRGYKITTDYGYSITCGEEHLLMSDGRLVKAKDLSVGDKLDLSGGLPLNIDYVRTPGVYDNAFDYDGLSNYDDLNVTCHCGNQRSVKVVNLKKRQKCGSLEGNAYICEVCSHTKRHNDFIDVLNEELAEFIGLYIGDGYATKKKPKHITISCNPQDKDLHNHIINRLKNIGITAVMVNRSKTIDIIISSADVVDWLDRHGLLSKATAHDAVVPRLIMRSPSSVIAAFLRGYFEANGWHHAHIGCHSVSKILTDQIQYLLLVLGIRSAIKSQPTTNGHHGRDGYRLEIRKKRDKIIFNNIIGFISDRKRSKYNEKSILNQDKACDNRIDFQESIRSIEPYIGPMCDVTLSGDNLYNSNGFISHNSGGWPTLQHGGSVIVISTCVVPDTVIMTADGLKEIQELAPNVYEGFEQGYYHATYNGPDIVGINGLEPATKFYKRPTEPTKIITTTCGYKLEASLKHKIRIVDSQTGEIIDKYVHDLQVGDYCPVKAGQMVFGNDDILNYNDRNRNYREDNPDAPIFRVEKIDTDLAYLLGVIIAEGHVRECLRESGQLTVEVLIACGDPEVLDRCESWGGIKWHRGRKDQDYVTACYMPMFVRFLRYLGVELTTAPHKTIPRRILRCSEPIVREFLKGLFDGDGSADKKNGRVCYCSTSYKLIKQVRMLLFNYGIHTYLETIPAGTTTFLRKSGETTTHTTEESYKLVISANFVEKFYALIGFGLERKQAMLDYKTSTWSELMPPVVRTLLRGLKDSTDLSIAKMASLGLASNVLYGSRRQITKNRLKHFMDQIDYSGNEFYDRLKHLLEYDWFNSITELDDSENEVYDFTLPLTHTFIGDCFININTNGVGGWFWATVTEAEAGIGMFNPIIINWYDMDWVIEYIDPISRQNKRIAPLDGLKKCTTKEEISKYGPYWSPWLETQYQALQTKGEAWKFEQEILASFIGSGNTVLPKEVLAHISTTVREPDMRVTGIQTYVHPQTGEAEEMSFDFAGQEEGLWVWHKPIIATPEKRRGDEILEPSTPAHTYVMGVDTATGKGKDYHAIEVFDVITREQVAEFMARCLPRDLVKYIDRIGRWYNCALAVIERNNGGDIIIDELRYQMMYPRLYRKKDVNDKPMVGVRKRQRPLKISPYGFATTLASKPTLNQFLLNFIRDNDEDGYRIYSARLLKQLHTYVRKRDRLGHDTSKTEAEDGAGNFDDLVIATGLSFIGTNDTFIADAGNLMPMNANLSFKSNTGPILLSDEQQLAVQSEWASKGGANILMPLSLAPEDLPDIAAQRILDSYTIQLGGIPISEGKPIVTPRKYFYDKE
jgi:intein/homing endonuclease